MKAGADLASVFTSEGVRDANLPSDRCLHREGVRDANLPADRDIEEVCGA